MKQSARNTFSGLNLIILLLFTLALSACSMQQKNKEEQPNFKEIPQVNIDYNENQIVEFNNRANKNEINRYEGLVANSGNIISAPEVLPSVLFYDSGINIPYPEEGVKGIYLPVTVFEDEQHYQNILDYLDQTHLNTVVIDFKDDAGQILGKIDSENPLVQENIIGNVDFQKILKDLEAHQIYPIARIVTFKDNLLSTEKPEYSFKDSKTGETWQNVDGAQFINPFMKEVWDYNLEVAIGAAKLGFKEIQFDYVRFPEGFETFSDQLEYNIGDYGAYVTDDPEKFGQERVYAITEYLAYAKEKLAPYGAKISADIFGYTAIAGNAPDVRGIGQNFAQMAEQVDVVSSMIYPSHWDLGFFGLEAPDLQPYEVVDQYMYSELETLNSLTDKPTTRPWLQDFTQWDLAPGTFQEYSTQQVQEQIVALHENGVHEFLLWNPNGIYSTDVDYAPEITGNQFYY